MRVHLGLWRGERMWGSMARSMPARGGADGPAGLHN